MTLQALSAGLLTLLTTGAMFSASCKGELQGEEPAAKPAKKKSNIIKVKMAVPYGQQLACADVFPDTAIFTEAIGDEIGSIKDRSASNKSASVVCSLLRAGEPPASPKELKTLEDKYAKLGVLPGDEYCQISAYCSSASNEDSLRSQCEKDGNQLSNLEGDFACLRATEKGADYSYTFKFIEPDTNCLIEAMAGPSVNEEGIVRSCAIAARRAITMASVGKPFKPAKRKRPTPQ